MIQKFEVGEIAVMCNARFHPDRNGQEVTVCHPYGILPIRKWDGNVARAQGYGVITREGRKFVVQPWQLRKKPPREELGSWDQCVWRPQRSAR